MAEMKNPLQSFRRFDQMEYFISVFEDRKKPGNRASGGRNLENEKEIPTFTMRNQLKPERQKKRQAKRWAKIYEAHNSKMREVSPLIG